MHYCIDLNEAILYNCFMSLATKKSNIHVLHLHDTIGTDNIPAELARKIDEFQGCNVINVSLVDRGKTAGRAFLLPGRTVIGKAKALGRLVKDYGVDIIHTHHPRSALLAHSLPLFRGAGSIRKLHTVHNDYRHYSRAAAMGNARAIARADHVICNSQNTLESIPEKLQKKARRFSVVLNGVNIDRIDRAASLAVFNASRPNLICVGRLVPQKNHLVLLRAFARVVEHVPDALLTLCGDGPERDEIRRVITELGLSGNVHMDGELPRDEVYRRMSDSHAAVHPSLFEGFCNANIEAMAAGTCLITTNREPVPSIVRDGALLVDPEDEADIALTICRVLQDRNMREGVIARGREVAETYSIERAARSYIDIYQREMQG